MRVGGGENVVALGEGCVLEVAHGGVVGGPWVVGCEERTWLWLSGERVCVWEEDLVAVRKSVYFHCQESSVCVG